MISKERLEELIEQGATIYESDFLGITAVTVKKGDFVENNGTLHIKDKVGPYDYYYNENLFETKEEAEWYREFGCIERTERLELPTWEEFKNYEEFTFIAKKSKILIYVLNHFYDNEIYITDLWGYTETFEYTKEGYTLACRKAKELFLGEKENV